MGLFSIFWVWPALPPRVRALIHCQKPLAVDAGIDLRGRERGVAEQFLDRAQIAAAAEQMGGEGMPQRMRRGAVGQAERAAQPLHGELDDSWRQWSAARADEDRAGRGQRMR